MFIDKQIKEKVKEAIASLYGQSIDEKLIQVEKTNKDYTGDWTVVVFPFLRISRKSPEITANEIGGFLKEKISEIADFNIIKGFLNLRISPAYWLSFLNEEVSAENFGTTPISENSPVILVEFSSPNTNKPLHLGHVRNNLIGFSLSEILKANGYHIVKVNLVNDRGIHICKSMLAWQKWGNGETPESAGTKGDKLVGKYYVMFDQEYKKQIAVLVNSGMTEAEATKKAPMIIEAQEMLRKWEAKDTQVIELWRKMNGWVYAGFDSTYKRLGIDFDKIYYESETFELGKSTVLEGLKNGSLLQKDDGSVWADLTADGLDEKLLLRSDGTSVYMTQDIGTFLHRYEKFKFNKHIYVVGNEQNYHFDALKLVLKKLGYPMAAAIYHLSYGMVELPEGKMKSREGTVVDADDLMDEMITTARDMAASLGKLDGYSVDEAENTIRIVGLGALKYFILKVDPKKNMTFDPNESVDFNGNTGPFIQYTYARIRSVLRKAGEEKIQVPARVGDLHIPNEKEAALVKLLYSYPAAVADSGREYSPAFIANYAFELAKEFNQFYHDHSILSAENAAAREFRLVLSAHTGRILKAAMKLLGIEVPERM